MPSMMVSLNDCDTFSDTYGCIFNACLGYQSPFPIVRFGDRLDSANEIKAVAMVRHSGVKESLAWRLLGLDILKRKSCSSFEQLLSTRSKFLELKNESQKFFRNIDQWKQVTGIAFRTHTSSFSASFYHQPRQFSLNANHIVVKGIQSLSFTYSDWVWCAGSDDPLTVFSLNIEHLFSETTTKTDFSVELPSVGNCNIMSATGSTAIVFHEGGIYTIDKRNEKKPWVQRYIEQDQICSGGISGGQYLVCSTKSEELLVFDRRKMAEPLLRRGFGAAVSVRSHSKDNVALLVTRNQVGVLDVVSLETLGSVQATDGDILDATVFQCTPQAVQLCITESNGMLYEWSMTH
ncbi:unnamed protein product [Phytomonas sp. Hart1]|nr:unnamed protein product [Phytomonas sp. Hart1]|eukprot:CCW71417.1 unnamed protein product [Phytomonas sp. isolate Hart1]